MQLVTEDWVYSHSFHNRSKVQIDCLDAEERDKVVSHKPRVSLAKYSSMLEFQVLYWL
jgi:hypothetical protein